MAKSYLDLEGLTYFWDLIKTKLALKQNISDAVTGVKGNSESSYRKGNVNITQANIGLGNVTNNKQVVGNSSGTVQQHIVEWGTDGYHLQDSGLTIHDFARSNAVVTGVKGSSESTYRKGDVNVTAANIGLGNVTNNKQVIGNSSGTTSGHIVTWGSDGYHLSDSGLTSSDIYLPYIKQNGGQPTSSHYGISVTNVPDILFSDTPIDGQSIILHLKNNFPSSGSLPVYLSLSKANNAGSTSAYIYINNGVKLTTGIYNLADKDVLLTYHSEDIDEGYDGYWTLNYAYYKNATQSSDGLFSSTDKTKLDAFSEATDYVLASTAVTGVKGSSESTYRTGNINITPTNIGLGNVTNNAQVKGLASGTTSGHIVTWGANGYTVADSGKTIANLQAVATQSANGYMSSADKKKLDAFGAASTYALKSDISTMYKYKGSVANMTALNAIETKEIGDVYNVEADNSNYAWDGTGWDSLGGIFEITSITQTQIDTIVAS